MGMLVLTRKPEEKIDILVPIDEESLKNAAKDGFVRIELDVLGFNRFRQVRLGFTAPKEVVVDRREITLLKQQTAG